MRYLLLALILSTGCNLFETSNVGSPDAGLDGDSATPVADHGPDEDTRTTADMRDPVFDGATADLAASDVRSDATDLADLTDSADVFDATSDGADAMEMVARPDPVVAYDFAQDTTDFVSDVSGGTAYDLLLVGDAVVSGGEAIIIGAGALQTAGPPTEFYDAVAMSDEFAIAVWFEPADLLQGSDATDPDTNRRIVTLSSSSTLRNVTLAQWFDKIVFRVRTTGRTDNALPNMIPSYILELRRQHHVLQVRNGMIEYYVDGQLEHAESTGGDLSEWDDTMRIRIGDEFASDRQWQGAVQDVRLYGSSLTPLQIEQLFNDGPD